MNERIKGTEEDQARLEREMKAAGIKRYNDLVQKAQQFGEETGTSYGAYLLAQKRALLTAAIDNWKEKARKGAGRRHTALPYLELLDSPTIAYITLRMLLDSVTAHKWSVPAAKKIADALALEMDMRNLSETDKVLHRKILKVTDTKGQYFRKKYTASFLAGNEGHECIFWPEEDATQVGMALIELCVYELGMFTMELLGERQGKTQYIVKATQHCLDIINKCNARCLEVSAVYQPMVVPPFPWKDPYTGGYLTNDIPPITLVKTRNKAYLDKLCSAEMPDIYKAINKIQATPWRINYRILELLKNLQLTSSALGGLPPAEDIEDPKKPTDIADNTESLKQWKIAKRDICEQNVRNKSKRLALCSILITAEKYAKYEAIYFPWQFDFRCRIYPVTNGSLSPQGADYVKALLEFAEGEALGTQEAVDWLAIHVANVWGHDKLPFEDRVKWVSDNSSMLCAVAENPYDYRQWCDADKPFQAVAAAIEWAGYIKDGLGHITHIPVALDGSCSGLQHLGMALRCEKTAAAVNLIPADKPQDIYQRVIDKVGPHLLEIVGSDWETLDYKEVTNYIENKIRKLYTENKAKYRIKTPFQQWLTQVKEERKNADGTPKKRSELEQKARDLYFEMLCAFAWLDFGYDKDKKQTSRKLSKNAVMTFPYGSKQFGFTEQLKSRVIEKALNGASNKKAIYYLIWEDSKLQAVSAGYLANLLYSAVCTTVDRAAQGMDWLQRIAKEVAKDGEPIRWQTLLGFPVEQSYWKTKSKAVNTSFLGKERVRFYIKKQTTVIDKEKQANAIAPNFVHSLDATHLLCTVLATPEVQNWALVHDSFGTTAAKAGLLHRAIRHTFSSIYKNHDVFAEFRAQLSTRIKDTQKFPLPEKGNLDPDLILNSQYCFG
ncbi:DNA-directed RNA polymerase [Zooshikella sp. RANM57]|uniref:DNA-directed RNA polymerase n=1 Tax=Zooshikella sp. RANM57 TaxID=3425863 RepID=UPI003D6F07B2